MAVRRPSWIWEICEYPHKTCHTSKPPIWNWNGYSICNTFGDICEKHQNFRKKWPLGGHFESENVTNIPIWLVIPQNPPFGTGLDSPCAILLEIYVKNLKISGKMAEKRSFFTFFKIFKNVHMHYTRRHFDTKFQENPWSHLWETGCHGQKNMKNGQKTTIFYFFSKFKKTCICTSPEVTTIPKIKKILQAISEKRTDR